MLPTMCPCDCSLLAACQITTATSMYVDKSLRLCCNPWQIICSSFCLMHTVQCTYTVPVVQGQEESALPYTANPPSPPRCDETSRLDVYVTMVNCICVVFTVQGERSGLCAAPNSTPIARQSGEATQSHYVVAVKGMCGSCSVRTTGGECPLVLCLHTATAAYLNALLMLCFPSMLNILYPMHMCCDCSVRRRGLTLLPACWIS